MKDALVINRCIYFKKYLTGFIDPYYTVNYGVLKIFISAKEIKILKKLLIVTLGFVIIGIILNFMF
jgi:hypothetical protein